MTDSDFIITYNNGNGVMTLHLDVFFERNLNNKNKPFRNTTKPDIHKVFKLINDNCSAEDILSLLEWLSEHDCEDLVTYYTEKYQWIKEYLK